MNIGFAWLTDENNLAIGNGVIFSLVCRKVTDVREVLLTFQVSEGDVSDKIEFMNMLAGNIAKCCCRTDSVSIADFISPLLTFFGF